MSRPRIRRRVQPGLPQYTPEQLARRDQLVAEILGRLDRMRRHMAAQEAGEAFGAAARSERT
jgi:hypothetical protein